MLRLLFEWRHLYDVTDPGRNVGLAIVSSTPDELPGLVSDLNPASFEMLGVDHTRGQIIDDSGLTVDRFQAEREQFLQRLYRSLSLAERPEIKNLLKIVVANTAGDEHSEERFVRFLLSKELERRWVGGASERQFCPDRCEPILRETVAVLPEPKPRLVYGVPYGRAMTVGGETKSSTAVSADARMLLDALIQAAAHRPEMVELKKAHQSRKADASRLFQQPEPPAASTAGCKPAPAGAQPEGGILMSQLSPVSQASSCDAAPGHASGALTEQLSRPDAAALGGIDFSSLELRYLADANEGAGSGLRYAFRAQSGAGPGDRDAGLQAAREASDAFFVWLALPPRRLWVNLGRRARPYHRCRLRAYRRGSDPAGG
jgi:hypothetical protein